jgi:P4 family phage/plasmid primase-like protien
LAAEIQVTNEPFFPLSPFRVNGTMAAIAMMKHTDARPFQWITKPEFAPDARDMIPFRNGLLDVGTGDLIPYTGDYFATGRPDFDYDPAATCPRWRQALGEWFEDASVAPTLQEFFGYVLTPDTSLHAILALLGAGRAGKSTIVVLEQLTAPHAKQRILGDLAGPHGLEGLEDARLLVLPDAADANLSNRATALGRIKAISGGDRVSINPKNLKVFECVIPARLVIVANRHPKFLDDSGAMAMRELPIMFNRSFASDDKRDLHLGAKLKAELPGIANWALAGLRRLRQARRFTESAALHAARGS